MVKDKIFEVLGVKAEEVFHLKDTSNKQITGEYKFDKDFCLKRKSKGGEFFCSTLCVSKILNGSYEIIKTTNWTNEEKFIIEYCKMCNCEWIAKDKDGVVYMYSEKPHKGAYYWRTYEDIGIGKCIQIGYDMPNIHWEDSEPTNILEVMGD